MSDVDVAYRLGFAFLKRSMLLAAIVSMAAGCGGGGDGAPQAAAAQRQAKSGSTCVAAVMVTVARVRLKTTAGGWLELTLPQAQEVDLRSGATGLFALAGSGAVPAGDYSEVRLVLSDADSGNVVRDAGGASSPLFVPSGSTSGLKIKDRLTVPAGRQGADLIIAGLDPCTLERAGNGRYVLAPTVDLQVMLTDPQPVPPPLVGPVLALPTAAPLSAGLPGGGFVAVEPSAAGDSWAVQRFTAAGTTSGTSVAVPVMGGDTGNAQLLALPGGGYAAVWLGDVIAFARFGGQTYALMMQAYSPSGAAIGLPVQIGGTQPFFRWISAPIAHAVAAQLVGGGFVVAWVNSGAGGLNLLVQRFNDDGTAASGPQVVAPDVSGLLGVGPLATGGYMVTWSGGARAYTASDIPVGPAQAGAPTWSGGLGTSPQIAALASGAVIVWTSLRGPELKAQALILGPDAAALTAHSIVDGSGLFDPSPMEPAASGLADGSYVLAWVVPGSGGNLEVLARRLSGAGVPLGPNTRVDPTTTDGRRPAVLATSDGGFVIAWTGTGADGVRRGYMRAFSSAALLY